MADGKCKEADGLYKQAHKLCINDTVGKQTLNIKYVWCCYKKGVFA